MLRAPSYRMQDNVSAIYFYGHKRGRFACLSNWFPSSFVDECGHRFANSEQAMMYQKAMLFGDVRRAGALLLQPDPMQAKNIGRQVENFDEATWRAHARRLVTGVLLHKFSQNAHALEVLLSTGDKPLAEASKTDTIWGIGLSVEEAEQGKEWRGANWLGQVLCDVRTALRGRAAAAPQATLEETDANRRGVELGGARAAQPSLREPAQRAYTHLLVLDFEATCENGDRRWKHEVIEFPALLLEREGMRKVDEFRSFVRPTEIPLLTAFCTQLTSITQAQVDAAPTLETVLAEFERWLEGHGLQAEQVLPVTCGAWDLVQCLPNECKRKGLPVPRALQRFCNVKVAFSEATGKRATGMAGMLTELGLPLIGRHHLGIDDARNIATIAAALLEQCDGLELRATGGTKL